MEIIAKVDKASTVHIKREGSELINHYAAHHRLSVAIALLIVQLLDQQELSYCKKMESLDIIMTLSSTMAKNVLELNNDDSRETETDKPF